MLGFILSFATGSFTDLYFTESVRLEGQSRVFSFSFFFKQETLILANKPFIDLTDTLFLQECRTSEVPLSEQPG